MARRFDSPQQEVFLNLWRTYDRLHALEEKLFARYGLTPQQYNVLRLLRGEHPRGLATLRTRVLDAAEAGEDAGVEDVVVGVHRALAESPASLVVATLEDALRVERRPNIPGTQSAQRPNWSIPLPVPVDDLGGDVRVRSLVRVLRR